MSEIMLLHGSEKIVEHPDISFCNDHNDYGRGFYCTKEKEMAKEWACKNGKDGFVNRYMIDSSELSVLNLMDGKHTVLNWIAILLKNRVFSLDSRVAIEARDYLISHFEIETSRYDLITGYRADDSYFRYAESFLGSALPLSGLYKALTLGRLGLQTALVSERAFQRIRFIEAEPVDGSVYYPKLVQRDSDARRIYKEEIAAGMSVRDDLFMMDIIRKEIGNDDPRIQRIVFE